MKHLHSIIFFLTFLLKIGFLYSTTYTVTTANDTEDINPGDQICADINGDCSLRAAILETKLDFTAPTHTINFNIPGVGPHTIQLAAVPGQLDQITNPIILDATTQAGYSFGNPQIVIDGSLAPAGDNGLVLQAPGCTIRGLVIGGFTENAGLGGIGIFLDGEGNQTIAECFIGVAADGVTPFPNFYGIYADGTITGTDNNLIGGITANQGNLLSNNASAGIYLVNSNNNRIVGNFIGTDITGTVAAGNFCGVGMEASSFNTIGGTTLNERNIISANDGGIDLVFNCFSVTIQGNFIGTDITGTAALANDWGIRINDSNDNTQIGGLFGSGAGNLISGNTSGGIQVSNDNSSIQGNLIGVQSDFSSPLANGNVGISVRGGTGHLIGGPNNGNIIAHHDEDGIQLDGVPPFSVAVATATKISQNAIFGNAGLGIDLGQGTADEGENANDITDVDGGPNFIQNFAEMSGTSYDDVGEILNLTYDIIGDVGNLNFPLVLEVFIADANGQGQIYYGSDTMLLAEFPQKTIAIPRLTFVPMTGTENIVNTITDANGNTSEFSNEAVLPLDNVILQAQMLKNAIELSWPHEQDDRVIDYIIERKGKNQSFTAINEMTGNHPTGSLKILDQSPIVGNNTYRLKMTLPDGGITYSNIVEITYSPQNLLTAYIDQQNTLQAKIYANQSGRFNIKLIDIQGRIISEWQEEIKAGENKFTRNISNLSTGNYVLVIPSLGQKVRISY